MFELLTKPVSAPRGELVTYASRSAMRCSSDGTACSAPPLTSLRSCIAGAVALRSGAAEGDDVWPDSGDTDAMIPVSNKTRSITRVRYKHAPFWQQEKWRTDFALLYRNSAEDRKATTEKQNPPSAVQAALTYSAESLCSSK